MANNNLQPDGSLGLQVSKTTTFDEIDRILDRDKDVTKPDSNGYDLIQQSIISGNDSALSYLLTKTNVLHTYRPTCNEYLHLACKLGHHVMVKIIIEAQPGHFQRRGRVCFPNPCFHADEEQALDIAGQLPLDIIVANEDIECLLQLLRTSRTSTYAREEIGPVTILCDLNDWRALQLLLKSSVPLGNLSFAYRQLLLNKRHQCLEALLSAGYKDFYMSYTADNDMNPFHFIYQYSDGFSRHCIRHEGLTAITQVLLKFGVDAAAHKPLGSYPLYSLLDLIMKDVEAYGEEYVSGAVAGNELLSCLKLILKQGVRIDLDEVEIRRTPICSQERVAFGRELYSSAFDCLSAKASSMLDINLAASEVIVECASMLLDVSAGHSLSPSDLTGIIELIARARRSKSIQKNLEKVVYQYLWHGLNPGTMLLGSYSENIYLVNKYVEILCSLERKPAACMAETLNDNVVVKWLVHTMTYNALCKATPTNLRLLETRPTLNVFTPSFIRYICAQPLLRLKTLAARAVWFAINRQKCNLAQLPIPNYLKSHFLDIIIKEI